MGEVLNFENFQSKHQQYIETCKKLYDRINSLYNQIENELGEHEKALFKKVSYLFNEVVTTSFLSLEEQTIFIEKYNSIKIEEQLIEFVHTINYIYMTYLYKRDFLKQKSVYIQAILDTISDMEIPYTSFSKIFNVFLNEEVSEFFDSENDPRKIKFILEEIIDCVNFDNHKDLVFKSCLDYLNEIKTSQEELKTKKFDRSMKSIYEYYLNQMKSFNELIEDTEVDLGFNKEKLDKLKKITMLEFLPNNRKEEFYDTVEYLCKKMGLLEQCRNLLMMIDVELEFLKNSGIIIEGVTYENRRL